MDTPNYNSSIVLPMRAILEDLILRFALAPWVIFSSKLPAVLGVSWKVYPQLYWEYIFQFTPRGAGPIRENITKLIEDYGELNFNIIMCSPSNMLLLKS